MLSWDSWGFCLESEGERGKGETKGMLLYLPHFPKGNQVGCRVNTQCFLRKLDILCPCLGFSFGRPVRLGVSQQAKCSRRNLALIWLRCPNGSQLWAKPVCILYEAILIFLFMLVLKWFTLMRKMYLDFQYFSVSAGDGTQGLYIHSVYRGTILPARFGICTFLQPSYIRYHPPCEAGQWWWANTANEAQAHNGTWEILPTIVHWFSESGYVMG